MRIIDFIGVEYDTKKILPEYFSVKTRAGKDGFQKLAKPIDSTGVGRWKTQLDPDVTRLIESKAGKNRRKLGYLK